MDDLDRMAMQVKELCAHRQLSDIRIDLQKTKSVETTVNRILDGGFLEGTERDPSRVAHIILDSDDDHSSPPPSAQAAAAQKHASSKQLSPRSPSPQRSTSKRRSLTPLDDDLDSLPSLDELMTQIQEKKIDTIELDDTPPRKPSDDKFAFLKEWEDDLNTSSSSSSRKRIATDDYLTSDLEQGSQPSKRKSRKKRKATVDFLQDHSDSSDDDQGQVETSKEKRERLKQKKQEEREEKARQRKEAQATKKAKREKAKEEKKTEKERKKLYEQANRLRTDRQELFAEMILELSSDFAASPQGELLKEVIEPKKAEVRVVSTGKYTIAWRRKCTAEWDDAEGTFVPHELRVIEEPKVLLFMDIPRLCEFIQSSTMDDEIDRIQQSAGSRQIILMIEGLEPYYKKRTLLRQRDFERAVLENLSQGSSAAKKKSKADPILEAAKTGPTKETIEERLTYLQMLKSVMLVPTMDRKDSVDWIVALTADIANAMYKYRGSKQLRHQGPARSGTDAADSWSKSLQEIQLCTPLVARAITSSYPNAQALFRAYQRTPDVRDGEELLSDIQVERSVLATRDRTINKSMSKKIYTIFTCTNDQHYVA